MGDHPEGKMDMQVTIITESFLLILPDSSCLEVQVPFLPGLS